MENQEENTAVTLGISIPIDPSKQTTVPYHSSQENSSTISSDSTDKSVKDESHKFQFSCLPHSLDPNLGLLSSLLSSNIPYDKSTFNSWNIEPYFLHMLPLPVSNVPENSILVFGGLNPSSLSRREVAEFGHDDLVLGSTIFQYVLDTGVWKYYGTMIEPRCYHASILVGQYIYITGGYSLLKREHGEMLAVSSTDRLNLSRRQWKRCANMISARAAHAIARHKTDIFVFGGRNSFGKLLASVEVYNPDQDIWAEISSLPQPTMGLSATCIVDHIWLLGGITAENSDKISNGILSSVYSFSPSTLRWYEEVALPYRCAFSTCISNRFSLWLIGGCTFPNDSKENSMISCSSVLQLSLSEKSSKWNKVASLLHPRHALTAVLYDDNLYILGGIESNHKSASSVVEVININTHMSVECTNIPSSVCGCSSVLILQEELFHPSCIRCGKKHSQSSDSGVSNISHIDDCLCDFTESLINYADSFHVSSIQKDFSDTMTQKSSIPDKSDSEPDSSDRIAFVKSAEIRSSNDASYESTKKVHTQLQDSIEKFKNASFQSWISKNEDQSTKRYRASLEILLNSLRPKNMYFNFLDREKSTATKWQNYFDTLTSSERQIHKEVIKASEVKGVDSKTESLYSKETGQAVLDEWYKPPVTSNNNIVSKSLAKHEYSDHCDSTNMHKDTPSYCHSFLYVQSNLASELTTTDNISNFNNRFLKTSTGHSVSPFMKTSEIKKDSLLHVIPDMEEISITQDILPCIVIMGGEYHLDSENGYRILLYHCSTDFWEYAGNIPEYRCHHCVVYFKSNIYIIGGFDSKNSRENNNISPKTLSYDFCNRVWIYKANMTTSRAYHSAIVFNEKIYVIGGRDRLGNILQSVEAYDEAKNEWQVCCSLPYPVLGAAVTSVNSFILVFGGITYEDENEIISSNTMMFDLETNNWSTGPELEIPLAFSGVSSCVNSVWLYGGLTESEDDIVSAKDILKLDINSNTWTKVAELSVPRHASITLSLGDKIYVIGGYSTQNQKEITLCEEVDILKNETCTIESLPIAVSGKAGAAIVEM